MSDDSATPAPPSAEQPGSAPATPDHSGSRTPKGGRVRAHRIAPGGQQYPSRVLPRFHWELLACGTGGHELIGTEARSLRPEDAVVVRDIGATRWHRCVRCDAWVPLPPPENPTTEFPPDAQDLVLPLRGRPLRDKVILRLIAINRGVHFLVFLLISGAILLFSANRAALHDRVVRAISDLTGTSAGNTNSGILHEVERLFSLGDTQLYLFAAIALAYALVEGVEAVGLWMGRRWAEYLTLLVTGSLLPLEIYELATHATPFKAIAFVINIAVVLYLLFAKRLFGVRGGVAVEHARRDADVGWEALRAGAPPL